MSKSIAKVTKTIISSPNIYKPVGPYSQAVLANNTLYVSGVLGATPDTKLVSGAAAQTKQALENLKHILKAGGSSLAGVVKTTILLANLDDFADVNKVYAEYFPENAPARACYQVAKLPMNAAVEIEAVALSGDLEIKQGL
ncbi:unnamed protein product [Pieris macdunnoughi]|uniref:Uncharacterized protein n=2 Tax=Pieris TaxID=7115 RepID=A0A9P0TKP9_PIEBR|nr:unnamed protein product [Pieris macdunnoughi]CAH4030202.1 unnamed protein product [Pieris brassicae]